MARQTSTSPLNWIAAALGVSAPLVILIAAIGADIGWFSLDLAIRLLTLTIGWWLAILGTAVGLVMAGLSLRHLGQAWPWLLVGLLAPALTLGGMIWTKARADALPPIHETASDWSEPLGFSRVIREARGPEAWPVTADPTVSGAIGDIRPAWSQWAGRPLSEINAEACPEAQTAPRLVEPEEVIAALKAEGVQVIGESPWRVEGTQSSAFFGRARDVVVRMEPGATDIRVVERTGLIDLGDTCGLAARVLARLSD